MDYVLVKLTVSNSFSVIFFQVNGHDVTSVADDVAMTILRSSPRRLSMTLGRAVSNLVAPPSCDSLPDVVLYKTPSGQLGGALYRFSHNFKTKHITQYYLIVSIVCVCAL